MYQCRVWQIPELLRRAVLLYIESMNLPADRHRDYGAYRIIKEPCVERLDRYQVKAGQNTNHHEHTYIAKYLC